MSRSLSEFRNADVTSVGGFAASQLTLDSLATRGAHPFDLAYSALVWRREKRVRERGRANRQLVLYIYIYISIDNRIYGGKLVKSKIRLVYGRRSKHDERKENRQVEKEVDRGREND